MKLYRYMSFEYLYDTVLGAGFAAQYASRFDDAFEGVAGIRINGIQVPMRLAPSAFDQHYSILCFNKAEETASNHEMLMWSLYANKNMGVRIVLDLPWSDFMSMNYVVMGNVQYDSEIRLIDVAPPALDELLQSGKGVNALENMAWIESMFFVKHPCWEWEKEYRAVIVNKEIDGTVTKTKFGENSEARYYATFMKGFITGVDFGLNLWNNRRGDVYDVIRKIHAVRGDLTFKRPVCISNQRAFGFEVIA